MRDVLLESVRAFLPFTPNLHADFHTFVDVLVAALCDGSVMCYDPDSYHMGGNEGTDRAHLEIDTQLQYIAVFQCMGFGFLRWRSETLVVEESTRG